MIWATSFRMPSKQPIKPGTACTGCPAMKGETMTKYRVNWPIKGLVPDKKYLLPGDTVELDEDEAARSVEVGSLTLMKPGAAPGAGTPQGTGGQADAPVDISQMNKSQLVDYAQKALGLTLDINLSKKNLLAAIADAAAK